MYHIRVYITLYIWYTMYVRCLTLYRYQDLLKLVTLVSHAMQKSSRQMKCSNCKSLPEVQRTAACPCKRYKSLQLCTGVSIHQCWWMYLSYCSIRSSCIAMSASVTLWEMNVQQTKLAMRCMFAKGMKRLTRQAWIVPEHLVHRWGIAQRRLPLWSNFIVSIYLILAWLSLYSRYSLLLKLLFS